MCERNLKFKGFIMFASIEKINILCLFKLKVLFSLLVGLCLCGCDSIRNNNADILYPDNSTMQIWNQTDLDNIRNCLSCDYILMADIELIEGRCGFDPISGWLPISNANNDYFTGTFDGNNHKITGLWIDRSSAYYVGLFGVLNGSHVKDLIVEIDKKGIKGDVFVGAIAGRLERANITNSYVAGDVSGVINVGGIVGSLDLFSNIINSHAAGNISASGDNIGGIAGFVQLSNIANSNFTGNINSDGHFIGGIAGSVGFGNVADSYSDGNINGGVHVGGIVGNIESYSSATDSHFAGNAAGKEHIGGIAGHMRDNSFITNSYSTGNISGDTGIGGIAGYIDESNITNSYSVGNINGNDSVGGIIGWAYEGGSIANSYSAGNISGNIYVGGIAGLNYGGNITSSYFRGEIEGVTNVGGIVGIVALSSSVKYNAALNPFITVVGSSYDIGRIIGNINSNNDIVGNIALDTMDIKVAVQDGSGYDGTGKSEGDLKNQLTYETIGWKFGTNDDEPWQIDNNGLLYLYWQK
jgi:hypothetical protein